MIIQSAIGHLHTILIESLIIFKAIRSAVYKAFI